MDRRSSRTSYITRHPALRIVFFVGSALVATVAVGPVASLAMGLAGLGAQHPATAILYPGLVTVGLVGVTWIAFRLEGQPLRTLGLVPTRRRSLEFGAGFFISAVVFALVALIRAAWVEAEWAFDPASGLRAALFGLPLALFMLLPEELLFRGYAFRKAEAQWGGGRTIVVSSLLFGAYHLVVQPGSWGMGAVFLFAMPALGGLVFGFAAHRTGGLALPTGLHLGANWVTASVLGLAMPQGAALWSAPMTAAQITTLTAPDVLVRLPYLAGVAVLLAAAAAWPVRRRQGIPCPDA